MQNQISFRQYRTIDLCILGAVLAVSQALITFAASRLFPDQLYVVSPVAAVVTLVMMRWGPWAAVHAALGGAVFCWSSGGGVQHYIIYCVGNLLSLAALGIIRALGKERIRENSVLALTLAFAVQVLMLLGRAAMALLLGNDPGTAAGFIATDALSILFTLLVIWAARRVDGLLEDQKHYLLRIQASKSESNVERRGQI